jgi:methylamine utilization protein MauE
MLMVSALSVDPAVHAALRVALALLLLAAAAHKLRDLAAFRSAVEGYALLPSGWLTGAAILLVGIELSIGISLILPGLGSVPAYAAAALLATYSGAIAINLQRGRRDIDCGCAGPAGRVSISRALVLRNGLLIAGALVAALPPTVRPTVWLDAVTVVASVGMLALLYVSAETALANALRLRALTTPRIVDDAAGVLEGSQW